jgi:hypothetical protein
VLTVSRAPELDHYVPPPSIPVESDHGTLPQNLSAEDTTILATSSNRQDAEVAKARLADREIDALIVADDVHPPFPLTEGVELRVLDREADRTRRVLEEELSVSVEDEIGAETRPEPVQQERSASLTLGSGGLVQATAWTYVAAFPLMVVIILTGLFVGLLRQGVTLRVNAIREVPPGSRRRFSTTSPVYS